MNVFFLIHQFVFWDNVRIYLKLLMIISPPAMLGPSDPDAAAVEIEPKNEENGRLRSQICPEGEEEEEEEQVFEPLNTLTPHKTHQSHVTGK